MKRSWLALLTISLLSLLGGVAIAGLPTSVDGTVITAPTTTVAADPTTTVALTTTTVPVTTTTSAVSSTTTSTPTIDRTSFRVVAANGTATLGFAGRTAEQLQVLGYTQVTPTDTLRPTAATTIYYRPGFAAAAAQVATDLGLLATAVAELTDPVSQADADGDVVAALGEDLLA